MQYDLLNHIKGLLQSTTDGDWELWPSDSRDKFSLIASGDYHHPVMTVNGQDALSFTNGSDREIIINSKTYIQELVKEIERLNSLLMESNHE